MAAAEARAAWQRIANRVLVQDDAKRAPKFSAFPPSGLTPLPELPKGPFHPALNRNITNSSINPKRMLMMLRMDLEADPDAAVGAYFERAEKRTSADGFSSQRADKTLPGSEKMEPWWRSTGKDELTRLLLRKTSENVENCDLPPPQTVQFFGDPLVHLDRSNKTVPDPCEDRGGTSKTELLGALRFSQTRARKAEAMAQRARHEKEHIIELIFEQASRASAYKLRIQMLQWERLLLRRRIEEQQLQSTSPWRICSRAITLVLVGAGMLLGWLLSPL